MPRRAEWESRASTRILSILRTRLLCTQHQLESKISESGPLSNRPQPLNISDGIRALQGPSRITSRHKPPGVPALTFALRDFNPDAHKDHRDRYDMLSRVYPSYLTHAGANEHCADILEYAVHSSFEQSSAFDVIHSQVRHGTPKSILAGATDIDNSPPIDHVVQHKATGHLILVEDKNIRDWFYPRSHFDDIARLTAKALRNGLAPILVTRKVPFVSHRFFRRLGLIAFETHNQYFHPDVELAMRDVRHKDGLGFHDIRFSLDPIQTLVAFLDKISGATLTRYRNTFFSNEDTIRAFAIDKQMGYYELVAALGLPWGQLEEDELDYRDFY